MASHIAHFISACKNELQTNWGNPEYMKQLAGATLFALSGIAFGALMIIFVQ